MSWKPPHEMPSTLRITLIGGFSNEPCFVSLPLPLNVVCQKSLDTAVPTTSWCDLLLEQGGEVCEDPVPGVFLSETPSGTVQGLLDVPSVDTSDQVLGPSRPHQGYPWKDLSIVLVSH